MGCHVQCPISSILNAKVSWFLTSILLKSICCSSVMQVSGISKFIIFLSFSRALSLLPCSSFVSPSFLSSLLPSFSISCVYIAVHCFIDCSISKCPNVPFISSSPTTVSCAYANTSHLLTCIGCCVVLHILINHSLSV